MEPANTAEEKTFFDAIVGGDIQLVEQLVDASPDLVNVFDYRCFGATPITRICTANHRQMIEKLVELGADIDRRSDWKMGPWSPLHCAVMANDIELAEFLLSQGATIDLHTASGMGLDEQLVQLLKQEPDRVNEPGGDGCRPLHFANSPQTAQILLDHGAEIEARCTDHFSTPVQYLANHRKEVARYLFDQGATADIFSAVMAQSASTVKSLIAADPAVLCARVDQEHFPPGPEHDVHNIMTFTIGSNCTPLHAAAKSNSAAMVSLLIEAGHEPNCRGGYDAATPLHLAAWENNAQAAKALIACGADIDLKSGSIHNNSPAGWAIVAGSADVFELLLDHDAQQLAHFQADTERALAGEFRQYKVVSQSNYERIAKRLKQAKRP